MPYSVHLRDSGFDEEVRTQAEARYRAKLERLLGGEEQAIETYQQWTALVESDGSPTNADKEFGKYWQEVIKESIAAGYKGMSLPEGFEGYFEIRLAR
jgi:hypothetical protein